MPAVADWDAEVAVSACSAFPFAGSAWRFHKRRYLATDPGGSLKVSGRYNRGLGQFPEHQAFPALYLALGPEVCLGEVLRHLSAELLPQLNDHRLTELRVELGSVLDCREPAKLGLPIEALLDDFDYRASRDLAAAALARSAEAILVPSATRLGDNLVVFPTNLRPDSRLEIVASRDPRLHLPPI